MWCMRIKGVVISDDYKRGYRTIVRLNCKMWDCPHCGPQNAINWRAYLLNKFNKSFRDEEWCFFTITAHERHQKAEYVIANLQRVWKRLYDRLRRRYGAKHSLYIRIFERGTKKGRFHMHFLMNCGAEYDKHEFLITSFLSEFRHPECRWLKDAVRALGGGYINHIRRVWEQRTKTQNVGLVIGYIVKYMGKSMSDFKFPKHQRRVQTSRAIGSPKTDRETRGTWVHMRDFPRSLLVESAKPVFDLSTGEVLTENSFEGEYYYPPARFYKGTSEFDD